VLVVTLVTALFVIAAVATGCGSAKAKGVHGTSIAYVKVPSSKLTLQQGVTKIVQTKATTVAQLQKALTFVVRVKNDGDNTEHNVKVTLTIDQRPQPIRKSLAIAEIRRGTYHEVVFKGPFALTELINKIPVKVDVAPVSGETNLVNNSATYEVRFALSPPR
jgi:uncharacterized repeat protein (TIGR01451 family)